MRLRGGVMKIPAPVYITEQVAPLGQECADMLRQSREPCPCGEGNNPLHAFLDGHRPRTRPVVAALLRDIADGIRVLNTREGLHPRRPDSGAREQHRGGAAGELPNRGGAMSLQMEIAYVMTVAKKAAGALAVLPQQPDALPGSSGDLMNQIIKAAADLEALIIQASRFKRDPGKVSLADATAEINAAGEPKGAS